MIGAIIAGVVAITGLVIQLVSNANQDAAAEDALDLANQKTAANQRREKEQARASLVLTRSKLQSPDNNQGLRAVLASRAGMTPEYISDLSYKTNQMQADQSAANWGNVVNAIGGVVNAAGGVAKAANAPEVKTATQQSAPIPAAPNVGSGDVGVVASALTQESTPYVDPSASEPAFAGVGLPSVPDFASGSTGLESPKTAGLSFDEQEAERQRLANNFKIGGVSSFRLPFSV